MLVYVTDRGHVFDQLIVSLFFFVRSLMLSNQSYE